MTSGVIPIDKPEGYTSFDVIAKLRRILGIKRLGHSGTLDPIATGVLPVFIGSATRAVDIISDREKRYEAGFRLGAATDTQDLTGNVVAKSGKAVSAAEIEALLPQFCGQIGQIPPMYSAVKVGGRRLYDIARSGGTVERRPRTIEVYSLELLCFDHESRTGALSIRCSKGTYVRTLINDIGERLGTLGHMISLRRTYSQGFDISDCISIEDAERAVQEGRLGGVVIPVERCFSELPVLRLSPGQERMYKCGVRLDPARIPGARGSGLYRVLGGSFLGIGEIAGGELKVYKSFWSAE